MAGDGPKSSTLEDDDDEDPYYDLFDEYGSFSEEDLLNVISSPNPNLMDLSFTQNLLPSPTPTMEINETGVLQELSLSISNYDTNNEFLGPPFDDDLTLSWDMFDIPSDDLNDNSNVLGEIGNDNGNNVGRLEVITRVFEENGTSFETGGTSTMHVPQITQKISEGILFCSCCNLLRGLVHTNGQEVMRLDIHGGIGFICHAILETQRFDGSNEFRHQTLNFKDLKMDDVKKFIEDYCSDREVDGFVIVQDTNAAFYQAMHACSINNQSLLSTLPSQDDVPMSLAMPDESLNVPSVPFYVGLRDEPSVLLKERRKTPLAVQRERTGKLTLKDVGIYFHLPIEEAARKMSLCPTVVKKICRKGGLSRWPHRKIKSIEKKISSLRSVIRTSRDVEVRAHSEEEIEKLQKEINEICCQALKNFNGKEKTQPQELQEPNEGGDGGNQMEESQEIEVTPEEYESIKPLEAMGFERKRLQKCSSPATRTKTLLAFCRKISR